MFQGVYWNQPICVSVCVRNTRFCQSAGGDIKSYLVTVLSDLDLHWVEGYQLCFLVNYKLAIVWTGHQQRCTGCLYRAQIVTGTEESPRWS